MIATTHARGDDRSRFGCVLVLGAALVGVAGCGNDSRVDVQVRERSIDIMAVLAATRSVPYLSQPSSLSDLDVAGTRVPMLVPLGGEGELFFYLDPEPGSVLECAYAVAAGAAPGRYSFSLELDREDSPSVTLFEDVVEQPQAGQGVKRRRLVELSSNDETPARLVFGVTPPTTGTPNPPAGWMRLRLSEGEARTSADGPPVTAPSTANTDADPAGSVRAIREAAKDANVIVVVFDAARADRYGCYGYSRPTTPNVDRMAAESVRFERASCQAVYTGASTGTLMTGMFPSSHGAVSKKRIFDEIPTLAEHLRGQGYATASFTANHNAGRLYGYDRGFDTIRHVNYDPNSGERIQAVSTPELFRPLVEPWLEAHQNERFFLYLHLLQPHLPFAIPATIREAFVREGGEPLNWTVELVRSINHGDFEPTKEQLRYLSDLYDANLAYADGFVGDLRAQLEGLGILDRSLVIFLSDHGEALYEHGKIGHNNSLYQETVRIPMVIRIPPAFATESGGLTVVEPVGTIDIVPTVLDILGLPIDEALQGESLLPLMATAGSEGPLPAVAQSPIGDDRASGGRVTTTMPNRYVVSETSGSEPAYAFLQGYHKLILRKTGRCELYDLSVDPGETTDLAIRNQFSTRIAAQQALVWFGSVVGEDEAGRNHEIAPLDTEIREDLKSLGYLQ